MNTVGGKTELRAIKLAHTAVWAFFAGCIVAIPICALVQRLDIAVTLIAIVFIEVLVLLFNGWRCPLTGIAARYTEERRDNFDIYLPEWLARHNKVIFGMLYLLGILVTLARWLR
ncbi:MAG: hypothetical protein ACRD3J_25345 [Thermoanaerobaculia bacterium]